MFESRFLFLCFLLPLYVTSAVMAVALNVDFVAPDASDDFAEKLRISSSSVSISDREDATAQEILAAAQSDYANLIGVLYAAGYFGGVISIKVDGREAAEIPPLSTPSAIKTVSISVRHGNPFRFSKASVSPLPPGTDLPERFALGQQARGDLIRDATRIAVDSWRANGHAKANVSDRNIVADHRANTLSADIRIAPGPRLVFGNLVVSGESSVRNSRIVDIAGLPSGEVFSPDAARRSADRLRRTGAFRSVSLTESDSIRQGNTLDMTANIVDAKPRRVGFGAELSSLEGLSLSGFWMHRNLFGGAERFRVDGEVSGIGGDSGGTDYKLTTRFDRPATFSPDTGLFVYTNLEEIDDPDYRERHVESGMGVSHVVSEHLGAEAGLAYRFTEIDDDLGLRELQQLLFPMRLTWDTRNDPLNAREGIFLDAEVTPFLDIDNGMTGARFSTDARTYRAFGAKEGVILAARAQLGSVVGAAIADVPPDMLFFSGGAGTVRGQPYQSLAVDLGGGIRVGGRSFMAFSGEARFDVGQKFQAVVFADTGFVGQDSWGTENGNWHSGAGLGARYATGVGPIRVDLATPLNNGAGENLEIYIGIGQAF